MQSDDSFILSWKYMGHMIYLGGLEIQKAMVEAISQVLQPTNVN
jgi:hypothetical protein